MKIAITGGIADGKSTILGFLKEMGFATLQADDVVRELQSEPDYLLAVRVALGDDAADESGLRRDYLRERITADPGARRSLNEVTHEETLRRVLDWAGSGGGPRFVEIPLLIETCTQGWFDQVWVVSAGVVEQRRRLTKRLGDPDLATRLLSSQLPTEVKEAFADVLHRTNVPLDAVRCTVTRTLEELGLLPGER